MKLDIKALLALAVIAGIIGFFLLSSGSNLQAAPNLKITTIDGVPIELEKLKGKPYLLVFWATDCPGCVKEIPHLSDLYKEMGNEGFRIVAVAMPHDEIPLIRTMREQKGMIYDIAYDQDGSIGKAFGDIRLTPTNFLIAPDGTIALQKMGEFDVDEMRARIRSMLKG